MTALTGMTIERNVSSSSTNARPSTNANTNGSRDFMRSLKSCVPAVTPVTAYSASGSVSATGGITWLRSVSSA